MARLSSARARPASLGVSRKGFKGFKGFGGGAQAQLALWDYDDFRASPLANLSMAAPPAASGAPLVVQSAPPLPARSTYHVHVYRAIARSPA